MANHALRRHGTGGGEEGGKTDRLVVNQCPTGMEPVVAFIV